MKHLSSQESLLLHVQSELSLHGASRALMEVAMTCETFTMPQPLESYTLRPSKTNLVVSQEGILDALAKLLDATIGELLRFLGKMIGIGKTSTSSRSSDVKDTDNKVSDAAYLAFNRNLDKILTETAKSAAKVPEEAVNEVPADNATSFSVPKKLETVAGTLLEINKALELLTHRDARDYTMERVTEIVSSVDLAIAPVKGLIAESLNDPALPLTKREDIANYLTVTVNGIAEHGTSVMESTGKVVVSTNSIKRYVLEPGYALEKEKVISKFLSAVNMYVSTAVRTWVSICDLAMKSYTRQLTILTDLKKDVELTDQMTKAISELEKDKQKLNALTKNSFK